MKITIAQGLQLKNEYTTRIGILTRRVVENNQKEVAEGSKPHFDYDSRVVIEERAELVAKLVKLKYALDKASLEQRKVIYEISEVKAQISMWKSVPTVQGIVSNYNNTKQYVVNINKVEADSAIEALQTRLNKLLSDMNHFNNTTTLTVG